MAADTKLFEFMFALDEYQVLLMRGTYSFKELAAARKKLLDLFNKEKDLANHIPSFRKMMTKQAEKADKKLDKVLGEKAEWNKAWHEARQNGGKMWWDGYRKGVKTQRKIQHSDKPEADMPYLDSNCRIPVQDKQ